MPEFVGGLIAGLLIGLVVGFLLRMVRELYENDHASN